jgi:hypothetical protein
MGQTLIVTRNTLDQTKDWLGPFAAAGHVSASLDERNFYCPSVDARINEDRRVTNPQVRSTFSYWYSPAVFTAAELWDASLPENRLEPDLFRRSVGIYEVQFPDRKVVHFESGDHHRTGKFIGVDPLVDARLNVVCVDGHVTTRNPADGNAPLAVRWPPAGDPFPLGSIVPFSSPPDGFRGRDW